MKNLHVIVAAMIVLGVFSSLTEDTPCAAAEAYDQPQQQLNQFQREQRLKQLDQEQKLNQLQQQKLNQNQ